MLLAQALPLHAASGKLDRKALAAMVAERNLDKEQAKKEEILSRPWNPTEAILVKQWQKVLKVCFSMHMHTRMRPSKTRADC